MPVIIPEDHTNEHEDCTNQHHVRMLRDDIKRMGEVRKAPISVSAIAEASAAAEGVEVSARHYRQARDFATQQARLTEGHVRQASRKSFLVPRLPWQKEH